MCTTAASPVAPPPINPEHRLPPIVTPPGVPPVVLPRFEAARSVKAEEPKTELPGPLSGEPAEPRLLSGPVERSEMPTREPERPTHQPECPSDERERQPRETERQSHESDRRTQELELSGKPQHAAGQIETSVSAEQRSQSPRSTVMAAPTPPPQEDPTRNGFVPAEAPPSVVPSSLTPSSAFTALSATPPPNPSAEPKAAAQPLAEPVSEGSAPTLSASTRPVTSTSSSSDVTAAGNVSPSRASTNRSSTNVTPADGTPASVTATNMISTDATPSKSTPVDPAPANGSPSSVTLSTGSPPNGSSAGSLANGSPSTAASGTGSAVSVETGDSQATKPAKSPTGSRPSSTESKSTSSSLTSNTIAEHSRIIFRRASPELIQIPNSEGYFQKVRRGGKLFQCRGFGDCRMCFSRSEHLARHIRKHTGERPFQCRCGRSFSRLDNLRQHVYAVHAGESHNYQTIKHRFTPNTATAQRGAEGASAEKPTGDGGRAVASAEAGDGKSEYITAKLSPPHASKHQPYTMQRDIEINAGLNTNTGGFDTLMAGIHVEPQGSQDGRKPAARRVSTNREAAASPAVLNLDRDLNVIGKYPAATADARPPSVLDAAPHYAPGLAPPFGAAAPTVAPQRAPAEGMPPYPGFVPGQVFPGMMAPNAASPTGVYPGMYMPGAPLPPGMDPASHAYQRQLQQFPQPFMYNPYQTGFASIPGLAFNMNYMPNGVASPQSRQEPLAQPGKQPSQAQQPHQGQQPPPAQQPPQVQPHQQAQPPHQAQQPQNVSHPPHMPQHQAPQSAPQQVFPDPPQPALQAPPASAQLAGSVPPPVAPHIRPQPGFVPQAPSPSNGAANTSLQTPAATAMNTAAPSPVHASPNGAPMSSPMPPQAVQASPKAPADPQSSHSASQYIAPQSESPQVKSQTPAATLALPKGGPSLSPQSTGGVHKQSPHSRTNSLSKSQPLQFTQVVPGPTPVPAHMNQEAELSMPFYRNMMHMRTKASRIPGVLGPFQIGLTRPVNDSAGMQKFQLPYDPKAAPGPVLTSPPADSPADPSAPGSAAFRDTQAPSPAHPAAQPPSAESQGHQPEGPLPMPGAGQQLESTQNHGHSAEHLHQSHTPVASSQAAMPLQPQPLHPASVQQPSAAQPASAPQPQLQQPQTQPAPAHQQQHPAQVPHQYIPQQMFYDPNQLMYVQPGTPVPGYPAMAPYVPGALPNMQFAYPQMMMAPYPPGQTMPGQPR